MGKRSLVLFQICTVSLIAVTWFLSGELMKLGSEYFKVLYGVIRTVIYIFSAYICFEASRTKGREYLKYIVYFLILSLAGFLTREAAVWGGMDFDNVTLSNLLYLLSSIALGVGLFKLNNIFSYIKTSRALVIDSFIISGIIFYATSLWIYKFNLGALDYIALLSYLSIDISFIFYLITLIVQFNKSEEEWRILLFIAVGIFCYTVSDIIFISYISSAVQIGYFAGIINLYGPALIACGARQGLGNLDKGLRKYAKFNVSEVKFDVYFIWIYAVLLFLYIMFLRIVIRGLLEPDIREYTLFHIPVIIIFWRFFVNLNRVTGRFLDEIRKSRIDKLTGFYTREAFSSILSSIRNAKEGQYPLSLLLIDIDGMTHYNKIYGEVAGDERIGNIAFIVSQSFSSEGIFVRYGGDEFLCIFPGSDINSIQSTYQEMMNSIDEYNSLNERKISITVVHKTVFEGDLEGHIGDMELKLAEGKIQKRQEFKKFIETNKQLAEQQQIEVLKGFLKIIELKDRYTEGHSLRVAEYSRAIARRMGMKDNEIVRIYNAGMLHDIGKILTPSYILNKPEELNEEEMEVVKKHPDAGAEIVSSLSVLKPIEQCIRYHHERYDGGLGEFGGYPGEVSGDELPIGARIISVADSFDAMTTDRPYRKGMSKERAVEILIEEKGKQFHPQIVDEFIKIVVEEA